MATTAANYRGHAEPSTVHREESDESTVPVPELNCVKIAQDFILQYYSVRSRYPESLYRFYREDSTLTMGCHQDERVVTGKAAIAEHLASVGYHNCMNSVAAFNAQFVLPNCIVILISGDMSNNDEMLRRYCEMFSLIRYDVDRFYVKSHMFHFQDDAFNDNSACSGSVCEQPQQQSQNQPIAQETAMHEKASDIAVRAENGFAEAHIDHAGDHQHNEVTALLESHHASHPVKTLATENVQNEATTHQHPVETENHLYESHPYESKEATVSSSWDDVPEQNGTTDEVQPHVPAPIAVGPPISKTWAGIAGSGTTNHVPPSSHNQQHPRQPARRSAAPGGGPAGGHENGRPSVKFQAGTVVGESGESDGQEGIEPQRRPRGGPPQGGSNGHFRGGNANNQGPRKPAINLDRQLFVGNLPFECDENELRTFFEQFGPVMQVRVNPSKDNLPWYGFVVMDTVEGVNNALKKRPLFLRGNHRINAEKRNNENGGFRRDNKRNQFSHGEQVAR